MHGGKENMTLYITPAIPRAKGKCQSLIWGYEAFHGEANDCFCHQSSSKTKELQFSKSRIQSIYEEPHFSSWTLIHSHCYAWEVSDVWISKAPSWHSVCKESLPYRKGLQHVFIFTLFHSWGLMHVQGQKFCLIHDSEFHYLMKTRVLQGCRLSKLRPCQTAVLLQQFILKENHTSGVCSSECAETGL